MNEKDAQMTIWDFGVADGFDCEKCMWTRTYGFCYPGDALGRRYFYESGMTRRCSDFGTEFASAGAKS